MDDKIFLPVEKLQFSELFDWSDPQQRGKTNTVAIKPRNGLNGINGLTVATDGKKRGMLTRSNEKDIAIFRYHKKVFAVKEQCPHSGGPLHLGDIEEIGDDLCVRCPWHGWKIDLESGNVVFPPGHSDCSTTVYPIKVTEAGLIFIGFDGLDKKYFNINENDF